MSKRTDAELQRSAPPTPPADARLIYEYQLRNMEGRVLTLIESIGLPEKQETATKEIFKDFFYPFAYEKSCYLSDEVARNAIEEMNKLRARDGFQPFAA